MDSGHPGYSQKSNEANEFPQGRERGSCLEDSPQYREKIAVNTPMLWMGFNPQNAFQSKASVEDSMF
jgi:hypothetical protein